MGSNQRNHFNIVACIALCVLPIAFATVVQCPKECACNGDIAHCTRNMTLKRPGLTYIPKLPTNIKELYFSGNILPNITRQTFANITHLSIISLELNNCKISSISEDALAQLRHLKRLDLQSNPLAAKIGELIKAVCLSNITSLGLSEIGLHKMPHISNFRTHQLTELNLSFNKFRYLPDSVLSWCPNLQNLSLSGNFFTNFTFSSLPLHVRKLNVSTIKLWNGIPTFCKPGSKPYMPNLQILDISFNSFDDLTRFSTDSKCLSKLNTLILDGNFYVTTIPSNLLTGLSSIEYISFKLMNPMLHLSNFSINSSSLQHLEIEPLYSRFFPKTDATLKLFNNCRNLDTLSISHFKFDQFNPEEMNNLFSPLRRLRNLTIIDGHLVQVDFVSKLPKLEYLNLQRNHISGWSTETFRNSNVKHIDISRNNIAVISKDQFPNKVWATSTFDLRGNPFDCSKDLCAFRKWIDNITNKSRLIDYPTKYLCESPKNMQGHLLRNWIPTEEECSPNKAEMYVMIEIGAIIAGLLLLFGLVGAIIYRKRWYIKHYIYLMRSRKGYELIPDGSEFVYDAFVAYHCNDRKWIVNKLLPYLESQKQLKICMHERDFLPGKFIVDNIINNIESSRKVILVLSNDFSKSEWCQFEAMAALKRVTSMGVSSVIIIMLEEINSRHLTNVLKNLLETVTYIEWTTDAIGRKTFWGRLNDVLD